MKNATAPAVFESWTNLLSEAVSRPGLLLEAYSRFRGYSIGNQVAALLQCITRGIEPGPIATFNRWKELGRSVRKGAKALWLCMPVTVKRTVTNVTTGQEEEHEGRFFTWKPRWFVLSQTEGETFTPEAIPAWNRATALAGLGVTEVPFESLNGNVQGYAKPGRQVAISPLAQLPEKTLFHELAHVVLGHTGDASAEDTVELPRSLREAEAEAVALICLESLGLAGAEYCRGYIQNWLAGAEIPETNARRIFAAADSILKAGRS